MKNISYADDDADFTSDADEGAEEEGYTSDDAAELERCTGEALSQLGSPDPGPVVRASREEVKEAVWYYYFDVERAVGYLRGELSRSCFVLVVVVVMELEVGWVC